VNASETYAQAVTRQSTAVTRKYNASSALATSKLTDHAISQETIDVGTTFALNSLIPQPSDQDISRDNISYTNASSETNSAYRALVGVPEYNTKDITVFNASTIAMEAVMNASFSVKFVEEKLTDAMNYADTCMDKINQLYMDTHLMNPQEDAAFGAISRYNSNCSTLKNVYLPGQRQKVNDAYYHAYNASTINVANNAAIEAVSIMNQEGDNYNDDIITMVNAIQGHVDNKTIPVSDNYSNEVTLKSPLSLSQILSQTLYYATQMNYEMRKLIRLEVDHFNVTLNDTEFTLDAPVGQVTIPVYPSGMKYDITNSNYQYNLYKAYGNSNSKKVFYILKKAISDRFKAILEINTAQREDNLATTELTEANTNKGTTGGEKTILDGLLNEAIGKLNTALSDAKTKVKDEIVKKTAKMTAFDVKNAAYSLVTELFTDANDKGGLRNTALTAKNNAYTKASADEYDVGLKETDKSTKFGVAQAKYALLVAEVEKKNTASGKLQEASTAKKSADTAFIIAVNAVRDGWAQLTNKIANANSQGVEQHTINNRTLEKANILLKIAKVVEQFSEHANYQSNVAFVTAALGYVNELEAKNKDGSSLYNGASLTNKTKWDNLTLEVGLPGDLLKKNREIQVKLEDLATTIQSNLRKADSAIDASSVVSYIIGYTPIPPELGDFFADAQISVDDNRSPRFLDTRFPRFLFGELIALQMKTKLGNDSMKNYILDMVEIDPSYDLNNYSDSIQTSNLDSINNSFKYALNTKANLLITSQFDIVDAVKTLFVGNLGYKNSANSERTTAVLNTLDSKVKNDQLLFNLEASSKTLSQQANQQTTSLGAYAKAQLIDLVLATSYVNGVKANKGSVDGALVMVKQITGFATERYTDVTAAMTETKRIKDIMSVYSDIKTNYELVEGAVKIVSESFVFVEGQRDLTVKAAEEVAPQPEIATNYYNKIDAYKTGANKKGDDLKADEERATAADTMITRVDANLQLAATALKQRLLNDPIGKGYVSDANTKSTSDTIMKILIQGFLRVVYDEDVLKAFNEVHALSSLTLSQLTAYVYANDELKTNDPLLDTFAQLKVDYYKTHNV
jgi:hypothetical protein